MKFRMFCPNHTEAVAIIRDPRIESMVPCPKEVSEKNISRYNELARKLSTASINAEKPAVSVSQVKLKVLDGWDGPTKSYPGKTPEESLQNFAEGQMVEFLSANLMKADAIIAHIQALNNEAVRYATTLGHKGRGAA